MSKKSTLGVYASSNSWSWMAEQSRFDLHSDTIKEAIEQISHSKPGKTIYDATITDAEVLIDTCRNLGIATLAFSPPSQHIEGAIPLENLHLTLRNGRK